MEKETTKQEILEALEYIDKYMEGSGYEFKFGSSILKKIVDKSGIINH